LDNKIKLLLKITISIALLAYVVYSADLSKIYEVLIGINLMFFLLAFIIGVGTITLSAKKWQILLQAKGEKHRYRRVLKIYYIGVFFNIFLPTNIGGDVVKAYEMSKTSKKRVEAYSSVFMERFTGAIALLILVIIAISIYYNEIPIEVIVLVYCVFIPIFLFITLLITRKGFAKRFKRFYRLFFKIFERFSLHKKAESLYDSINLYKKEKKILLIVMIISLIFQSVSVIIRYVLSLSLGMDVPLFYFFIFIPICSLVAFLPISIRGIGVFEVLYLYFFTMVGATAAQAVSLAFLTHILAFINSLTGGVIYLVSNTSIKNQNNPQIKRN
jgi:uncharacterized protein (TIRG00374 family)